MILLIQSLISRFRNKTRLFTNYLYVCCRQMANFNLVRFISFIFCFFVIEGYAQGKMEGKYCNPPGYAGTCIEFNRDSAFIYEDWGCMGGEIGSGNYTFKEDTLILHFTRPPDYREGGFYIEEGSEPIHDKIQYEFQLVDGNSEDIILPYVTIEIGERINSDSIYYWKRIQTDIHGYARVKLPRDISGYEFRATYVGYRSVTGSLPAIADYQVSVIMRGFMFRITDEKYKYQVLSSRRNKMILAYYNEHLEKIDKTYLFRKKDE